MLKEKIVNMYQNRTFVRYDRTETVFYFSPADFEGLQTDPFSFPGHKGQMLHGAFYHYGTPAQDRVVVFDHGLGCGHCAYMREIEMLAKHGYLVYSYDHTGCGSSEGDSINGFAQSLNDLDHCLTALKASEQCRNRSFSVVGHSWGGYSTQNIPAFHPDVTHIVAISGPISVKALLKQNVPWFLGRYRKDLFAMETQANRPYADCDAASALATGTVKALLIHSDDDHVVSVKHNFATLKKSLKNNPRITFLEETGKKHNPTYTKDAVVYLYRFFADREQAKLTTEEEKEAFLASYDWYKMTEQDRTVWNRIFEHLDN